MRRADRDPVLAAWLADRDKSRAYLSAVTDLELALGVLAKEAKDPAQGKVLRAWLDAVRDEYAGRILAFDASLAETAASIGRIRTRGLAEVLIAATAVANSMTLATANTRDFDDIPGLALDNPWS
jgi:predicted nucleic acid-binding protein